MTAPSYALSRLEENRVLNWQKDVARSTASRAPPEPPSTTRVVVNHITTPTVVVSRAAPRPKEEAEISTRAIIGTILGAGAGAAVAYAMVKGEHEDRQAREPSPVTYPVKRVTETAVVVRPPLADVRNYQSQRTSIYDMDRPRYNRSISGPRVETVVSSARSQREPQTEVLRSVPPYVGSHTGQTIVRSKNGTKVLAGSADCQSSYASSPSKREKYPSSAADVPLPQGRVSTLINRRDTVVPNDSISQVSTNRPRDRERSSHHHHHHHQSSKSGSGHRRHPSYTSSRTARPDRSRVDSTRR